MQRSSSGKEGVLNARADLKCHKGGTEACRNVIKIIISRRGPLCDVCEANLHAAGLRVQAPGPPADHGRQT